MAIYGNRPVWHWMVIYALLGGAAYLVAYLAFLRPVPSGSPVPADTTVFPGTPSPVRGAEVPTIAMVAQNDSGQSGSATVTEQDGMAYVAITLSGYPQDREPQPAHVHAGECPGTGAIVYPLTSVIDGVSETLLDVPVSQLRDMLPLAINVHKSQAESSVYVSCGELAL